MDQPHARIGGDLNRVVSMMVGDVQRVAAVPDFGLAVRQQIPVAVLEAYWRLVDEGYMSRVIPDAPLSPAAR